MAERIGVLGYAGVAKETTTGTAVVPTDWIPFVTLDMNTDIQLDEDTAAYGVYYNTYQTNRGPRSHTGTAEFVAEPNTAAKLMNMLMTVGSSSGGGPYTWPFTASATTASYTIDKSSGNVVERFYGCQIEKMSLKFDKSQMRFTCDISALGSFRGRQIASVSGGGPYTVTLDTTYDPSPTTGLVTGDLIRFYHAGSATVDATVASVTNGTVFTTSTNPSPATTGDMVYLRPATVSVGALVNVPFIWPKSQYCFGTTASVALSATQTRLESGSTWEIVHPFNDKKGEQRSGAYDPASLVRLPPKPTLKIKKFFDTPDDLQNWLQVNKTACVIRHYAGSTNQYEFRVTFNNLRIKDIKTMVDAQKIIYAEIEFISTYDTSDSQGLGVTVINNISSLS
jgi:hypothetical protein